MKNTRQSNPASSSRPALEAKRSHPLDWPASAGAVGDVLSELKVQLKRRRRRQWQKAAGASVALLVLGLVWLGVVRERPASGASVAASSSVLLPERQTLADGTLVELRSGAKIAVNFSAALRRVTLEQGEAHFAVAKNPDWPFVVSAGGVEFRAVGTAFAVHLADKEVEMLVTEGRVAVERPTAAETSAAAAPAPLATVEAGNHVVVDVSVPQIAAPAVRAISKTELSRRLAWRAPKLEFSGTPLSAAIELINRHSAEAEKIQLGDPALADLRISGILRADNIDTLLGVLEADYGIKAEKREGGIVLRRDSAGRRAN
jgi:transmembrane sensor